MRVVQNKAIISGIAPFFIVKNVPAALKFYRDRLGFDITFQGRTEDDIFFGISFCQRGKPVAAAPHRQKKSKSFISG